MKFKSAKVVISLLLFTDFVQAAIVSVAVPFSLQESAASTTSSTSYKFIMGCPKGFGYNGYLYVFITAPNGTVEIFQELFWENLSVAPEIRDYYKGKLAHQQERSFKCQQKKLGLR